MEYSIRITDQASLNIDLFYAQIAARASDYAERWYIGLLEHISSLKTLPLRCPVAAESRPAGQTIRELLYGKRPSVYRILFAIQGGEIAILEVKHASQGPTSASF